ncbi:MAG: glycosyltransferase family A protein [Sideroxyarcus sp.]|nr:glycosyltransferase family A protein [Sideroxyarcus sp.]
MSIEIAPRVSVLVPMKNAEPYVVAALASVLSEKDVALEVVVINDKSTDRSLERVLSVRDERIRVIDGPGKGLSACLNAGLAAANGDVVMQCDADDLYPAGRIKDQVAWLDANPEYAAVCGGFSTMDTAGRLVTVLVSSVMPEEITGELNSGKTRTTLCSYALRKAALQNFGGFRTYFETSCDIDFQLRFGEVAKVMYLPSSFYLYRLHDASMTHTQGNVRRTFFEDTARQFQLQRKATGQDELQRGCPPMPPVVLSDKSGTATQQIQGMLIGAAWREKGAGNTFKAIGVGCRALMHSPFDLRVWRSFLALLVKPVKKVS